MMAVETAEAGVFLGLRLDEDLLREEFEAIIAAEFPRPRPPTRAPLICCGRPRRPPSQQCLPGHREKTSRATSVGGAEGPRRGRSPPDLTCPDE